MTYNVFGGTLNLTQQLSLEIGGSLLLAANECTTLSCTALAQLFCICARSLWLVLVEYLVMEISDFNFNFIKIPMLRFCAIAF